MERIIEKNINLRSELTKRNFRSLAFKFFRKLYIESNYICVLFKASNIIKSDKDFLNNEFYLGTQKILDVTNKDEVKNYIDYVTNEIIVKILNKKDKSKYKIVISYFFIDEDTFKNYHKNLFEDNLSKINKK